jgi:hypothetical protein
VKTLLFIFLIWFSLPLYATRITLTGAQERELSTLLKNWWEGDMKFSQTIQSGEVVSWSHVENDADTRQKMIVQVAGLHPRSCQKGLRKISRYEDYKLHMSFVKESSYDEKKQIVRLLLEHIVLPFPMVLSFKIPRVTTTGETLLQFDHGIFAGLKGKIRVASVGNRCLYFMRADWHGKTTGLTPVIVETFAQTLTKIGLEHLIRISTL